MKISKREDFSLIVMSILAQNYSPDFIPLSYIAQKTNLSPLFLKHIANKLKARGLIGSKEGMSGGYRLIKEPQKITMGDILESVSEGIIEPSCYKTACRIKREKCRVFSFWRDINKQLFSYLSAITLADYSKL